jgi:hypothetical protein
VPPVPPAPPAPPAPPPPPLLLLLLDELALLLLLLDELALLLLLLDELALLLWLAALPVLDELTVELGTPPVPPVGCSDAQLIIPAKPATSSKE